MAVEFGDAVTSRFFRCFEVRFLPVQKEIFLYGRWFRNRASGEAKCHEAHPSGCGLTVLTSAISQD